MSSSDSVYECFRPFSTGKMMYGGKRKFNYGHLLMEFNFSYGAIVTFSIDIGDGSMKQAFWKVVASAKISVPRGESATAEITCSANSAVHVFDTSALSFNRHLSVTMVFKELVGFGVVPRPWDYFTSSSRTDVCLLVDGQRFYQNKEFLAHHSPFFRTLFFGEFAEKNKNEINIEDMTSDRFTDLMDALHESHCFTENSLSAVLEDADRDAEFLLSEPAEEISACDKLFLSDKYRMSRLQAQLCLPEQIWCVKWWNSTTTYRGCADLDNFCNKDADGCYTKSDTGPNQNSRKLTTDC